MFNSEEVEEMRNAVEQIVQRAAKANKDANHAWQGDYIPKEELESLVLKGFHDVHYHDASFTKAVAHPKMVSILSKLIGPNVQLHHSKMLVKPPEKGAAFQCTRIIHIFLIKATRCWLLVFILMIQMKRTVVLM